MKIPELNGEKKGEIKEIIVDNARTIMLVPRFENKIGWAAPPIPLNEYGDKVIILLHGVDSDNIVYRVFAIELTLKDDEIIVNAVTPNYIMEPRTPYEVIGDRPLTIFPCGAVKFNKDHILITYGAGDYMIGFGIIAGGGSSIRWAEIGSIVSGWIISPLMGCFIAFLVFKLIIKSIFAKNKPVESAKLVGPVLIGFTAFMIISSLLLKTQLSEMLDISLPYVIIVSSLTFIMVSGITAFLLRKIEAKSSEDYATVESIFRKLQIITSCYVAFSHGANDVANAIAPVAKINHVVITGNISPIAQVPTFLLALGGFGIAIGCMTWGHKVMRTLGYRITTLTNTRGFSVDFGAATTVLIASKLGMPISTSHTVVGAVIGVGLARGLAAVDLGVIKKIIVSWLLTVPVAAGTSALIFLLLKLIM